MTDERLIAIKLLLVGECFATVTERTLTQIGLELVAEVERLRIALHRSSSLEFGGSVVPGVPAPSQPANKYCSRCMYPFRGFQANGCICSLCLKSDMVGPLREDI